MRWGVGASASRDVQPASGERARPSPWYRSWAATFHDDRPLVAAVAVLAVVSLLALVGPLISPETYEGFRRSAADLHPGFSWRYLFGTDAFGHSILMYVLAGARLTWGIPLVSWGLAMLGAELLFRLVQASPPLRATVLAAGQIVAAVPLFPLLLVLAAYVAHGSVWRLVAVFGSVLGLVVAGRLVQGAGQSGPPAMGTIRAGLAVTTLTTVVATEATLEFLGQGPRLPAVGWGTALEYYPPYLYGGLWWWLLLPGVCLVATLAAIQILGRRLEKLLSTPSRS